MKLNPMNLTCATRVLFGFLACFVYGAPQTANGQNLWEMRVCADPNYFPASSETQQGYENSIAEILADQLQADLEFVWTRRGTNMVQYHLHTGDCDLIMGVADGAEGLLTTIPYYRSPYVFLYRQSLDVDVTSLEDEALRSLRIGTYAYSIPHRALVEMGLGDDVAIYPADPRLGVPDVDTPLLEHLQSGEIDVAILYGPPAGYFAAQHPNEWRVVPVSPEFISLLQMFRIWTIGVRPGDEALRDRLNIALAERWEDIQAVFGEYSVPLATIPRPVVSRDDSVGDDR